MNQGNGRTVGVICVAPPFQYAGVAALETEREDIESDIRTSLVYNSNHPERHPDPAQVDAVGQSAMLHILPHRAWQRRHMAQVIGYPGQTLRGELQAVVQRI